MLRIFLTNLLLFVLMPITLSLPANAQTADASVSATENNDGKDSPSNPSEAPFEGQDIPDISLPEIITSNDKPDVQGMDNLQIFKKHFSDNPVVAARALLDIMDSMPAEQVTEFQDKLIFQITEMVISFDLKNKKGQIKDFDYDEITTRLGEYGLYTLKTDAYSHPEGNAGVMAIDTIATKPGIKPRPYLSPEDAMGNSDQSHGTLMAGSMQGTLIPPSGGSSAQLIPAGGKKEDAVELNPVTAMVTAKKAIIDGDEKAFKNAINTAERYFPTKTRLHVAAASLYYEAGDYKNSERAATKAIGLSKNDPEAYKARAIARSALNNRKGAVEDVNKAVEINPQDESARLLTLLIDSRKAEKSIKTTASLQAMRNRLGLKTDARDVARNDAVNMEGSADGKTMPISDNGISTDYAKSKNFTKTAKAKNRLGDYASAESYATLALEKDPDNLEAYLERANAYNSMGRYEDVIRDTTHVIEKDKENMQAFNLRSHAANQMGNHGAAAADAENAIGINPNFADAWFNRGLAAEKQGDYKKMLENYKQAASLSEAYNRKYQDALAQYGARVPGFSASQKQPLSDLGSEVQDTGASPMSRYLVLLSFMLIGGACIAVGLAHLLTGQQPKDKEDGNKGGLHGGKASKQVISPSVFYEGVATGKYKIEKKVGEGAMGKVYLAVDKSLGRKVAIKKMNDEIKVNEREKQRFLEEARTVALLHHPNIVEIYTIFEESGDVFLVFEYLEGRTLDTVLDKDIRMSFNRVKGIFEEVSKALEYAHSKGVIHRDLKLSNIMLTSEGYVKVMDFGLSARAIESRAHSSTSSGRREVVGSPAYMAPEQELGDSNVRSDIYSLGICLYESLTGDLPFPGPDFYNQKTRNFYEPVSVRVKGLPKGIDDLLERCIDAAPEKRFASAAEFRHALEEIHL